MCFRDLACGLILLGLRIQSRCRAGRGERIRTSDLTVPNRTRYQTAPRPVLNQLEIVT